MKKISYQRIGEYLQTALKIMLENGGSYPSRDLFPAMEKHLNLNDYEKSRYEKSGYVRWQSVVHFYSIDLTKAGWLKKNKGVWYITDEGKDALKLDPEKFIDVANQKYKEWKANKDIKEKFEEKEEIDDNIEKDRTTSYNQALENSRKEVEEFIDNLTPYEFQDLVAALLRGMGYFTPFVAPQGADGGVDIIAYKDPLGAEGARIKVQVKHKKETKVDRQEVAQLNGILRSGEVGLIVSSAGFSKEAIKEMRLANNHIEKMDLDDLVSFWEDYYEKLEEEDKALLPLRKISFLAPEE